MAAVSLMVGQCGVGLGAHVLEAIHNDGRRERKHAGGGAAADADAFFRGDVARGVLVDTEPKAVAEAVEVGRGRWKYGDNAKVVSEGGASNSWGRGFHAMAGDGGAGGGLLGPAMDAVRRQVEACDSVHALLLMQSAAGGTGAGLGARAAEALRDDFPRSCLTSVCVWPAGEGEVSVQAYNACLSLSHVADAADAVVVVQNDALSHLCRAAYQIPSPTMSDLNQAASRALAPAFLPAALLEPPAPGSGEPSPFPAAGIARPLVWVDEAATHPWYKLLQVRSHPHLSGASASFERFSFDASARALMRMHANAAFSDVTLQWGAEGVAAPAAVHMHMTLRGAGCDAVDAHRAAWRALGGQAGFARAAGLRGATCGGPLAAAGWPAVSLACGGASRAPPGLAASSSGDAGAAVLLSNASDVAVPLLREVSRGRRLLHAGAFAHRYAADGVSHAELAASLDVVSDLAERYVRLAA